MFISKFAPVIGALFASVQASPVTSPAELSRNIASPKALAERHFSSKAFDLSKTLEKAILYDGLAPASIGAAAEVDLHVTIPNAVISGNVDVQLVADFLVDPLVVIDLSGVQAYVELDIKADAEVYLSVELVTSEKLSLEIPGLLDVEAGLAIALDLVICLDAAIELSAGLYIDFPQGSFVKVNLLTSTVVDHVLNDLVAKALPLSLGVDVDLDAQVTLEVGLRLRTELGLSADVDVLGIPLLSAGADVAVWINLCDYTSVIIGNPTPECSTGVQESLSLDVGVIVEVDVDVLNILDLSLAPTISVTLAAAPAATSCVADCACSNGLSSTVPGLPASSTSAPATFTGVPSSTGSAATSTVSAPASSNGGSGSIISSPTAPSTATVTSVSEHGTTVTSTEKGATSAYTVTSVDISGTTVTATITPGGGKGYPTIPNGGNGVSNATSAYGAVTSAPSATITKPPSGSLTTSTFYETSTLTITSCAAAVVNCPAKFTQKVVTEVVYAKTTVCPVAGASSAVHWAVNSTSTATFAIPTAKLTKGIVSYTTYPATSAPAHTFTPPATITNVKPTVSFTGVPNTVTPVAATTIVPTTVPAGVASVGTASVGLPVPVTPATPVIPATLVTASSKTGSGATPTSSLPVTAGASKVVSHAGAFMALAAGLVLVF